MRWANQPQSTVPFLSEIYAKSILVDTVRPIMSAIQTEPSRVHPRRRPVLNTALPTLSNDSPDSKMPLKKGETFHTPTSPPSSDRDPVLNIRSLPHRSATSLEAITAAEERMTSILDRLTLEPTEDQSLEVVGESPLEGGLVRSNSKSMSNSPRSSNEEGRSIPIPLDEKKAQQHSHESDSGLGTSVSSEEGLADSQNKGGCHMQKCIVFAPYCSLLSANNE